MAGVGAVGWVFSGGATLEGATGGTKCTALHAIYSANLQR